MNSQQLRHKLIRMSVDTYAELEGTIVARTSNAHYMILRGGEIEHFGVGNWSIGLSVTRVIETLTSTAQPRPCGNCGKPSETGKSYCNACAVQATLKSRERSKARTS